MYDTLVLAVRAFNGMGCGTRYLGPFPADVREQLQQEWEKTLEDAVHVPAPALKSLGDFLVQPVDLRCAWTEGAEPKWEKQGGSDALVAKGCVRPCFFRLRGKWNLDCAVPAAETKCILLQCHIGV